MPLAGAGLNNVSQGLGLELPDDDTMFYITLTIEEEGKEPINITTGSSGDSDMDSTTYSHLSTDSSTAGTTSTKTTAPPPHRRKSSCSRPYSVVRPLVPPPAPPTSITKTSLEGQDSLSQSSQMESNPQQKEGLTKTNGGQEGQAAVAGNFHPKRTHDLQTHDMNLKCLIKGALNTSMIAQQVTQVKTVCCRAILSRSSTSVSVRRPQVVLVIMVMIVIS